MRLKPDGTRWRTGGGGVKGKLTNGVGSQYSHTPSERGVSSITNADAHTSTASSRLNWRPRRFKWTRPFRRKTKSGFCACAVTFQTHYTCILCCSSWWMQFSAANCHRFHVGPNLPFFCVSGWRFWEPSQRLGFCFDIIAVNWSFITADDVL